MRQSITTIEIVTYSYQFCDHNIKKVFLIIKHGFHLIGVISPTHNDQNKKGFLDFIKIMIFGKHSSSLSRLSHLSKHSILVYSKQ